MESFVFRQNEQNGQNGLRCGDRLGYEGLFQESHLEFKRGFGNRARRFRRAALGGGPKAMRAIASDIKARELRLSVFYISNVEYYLFAPKTFGAYAENIKQFPPDEHSPIIRSVFPSGGSRSLRQALPVYYSVSLTQPFTAMLADLAAGRYPTYRELVNASAR